MTLLVAIDIRLLPPLTFFADNTTSSFEPRINLPRLDPIDANTVAIRRDTRRGWDLAAQRNCRDISCR